MTTPIQTIFKDKKYPKWFQSHPIFKDVKEIKKVFPSVGLPNCEENVAVDNAKQANKASKALIKQIDDLITHHTMFLERTVKTLKNKERIANGNKCIEIFQAVHSQLKKPKNIIQINNGRISLKLSDDITIEGNNRPIFRKNESLFRVYNKLNEMLAEGQFQQMTQLEYLNAFKVFSTENIPNNDRFKIVFSSDGSDGAWDIGTMSMRGVSSCQSWNTGEYKHCTIGSVIDPFVGIIYMTSGGKFNEYGTKMIRRCIVRFVIDGKDNKPYLLIDRMYPSTDNKILTQFKNFLTKKTDGKFKVVYSENMKPELLKSSYIPLNPVRKKLTETSRDGKSTPYHGDYYETIQSYQDMQISSKSHKKDKQAELFDKNSKKKENKFIQTFSKAFVDAVKSIDVASVPKTIKPAMKLMAKNNNHNYVLLNVGAEIAKHIISNVDKTQFTNSDTYIRRVYYSFFNYRNKVVHSYRNELVKKLNGGMHLKTGHRFGVRNLIPLMVKVLPKMDSIMKGELKKVVDKRNAIKIEPLPLP